VLISQHTRHTLYEKARVHRLAWRCIDCATPRWCGANWNNSEKCCHDGIFHEEPRRDAHVKAEFIDKDVAATMATMVAEPYLTHVPTLTGGTGRSEVESFYRDHFVGHWPDDVEVKPLSRTVGQNRVVDELIVSFTHDREMRVFVPGVPPTGRKDTKHRIPGHPVLPSRCVHRDAVPHDSSRRLQRRQLGEAAAMRLGAQRLDG
jgi:hypothetical protein